MCSRMDYFGALAEARAMCRRFFPRVLLDAKGKRSLGTNLEIVMVAKRMEGISARLKRANKMRLVSDLHIVFRHR